MLDRFNAGLAWLCGALAALSMAGVFLIVFINSVQRYAIGRSLPWGEQMPVFLAIYGIMFGIALAYLQDRHIRFTILTDAIPERVRVRLFVVVDLAVIVTGVMLARSGMMMIESRGEREASGIVTAARRLAAETGIDAIAALGRMAPWQFALVLGGALLALAAAVKCAERIRDIRAGEV